jgi:hypothetical protein
LCVCVTFTCIYVLCIITQIGSSTLSSFFLSPLFMVVSTGLKIIYSFFYREYINHISPF